MLVKLVVSVSSLLALVGFPKSSSRSQDEEAQGDGSPELEDREDEEKEDEEERASETSIVCRSPTQSNSTIGTESIAIISLCYSTPLLFSCIGRHSSCC